MVFQVAGWMRMKGAVTCHNRKGKRMRMIKLGMTEFHLATSDPHGCDAGVDVLRT